MMNKNNGSQNKKRTVWIIVLALFIAAIGGYLLWRFVSRSGYVEWNLSELAKNIRAAAADASDQNYFKSVTYDFNTNTFSGIYVTGDSIVNFQSAGNPDGLSKLLVVDDKTYGAWMEGAFGAPEGVTVTGYKTLSIQQEPFLLSVFLRFLPTLLIIGFLWFMYNAQFKAMGNGMLGDKNPAQKIKTDKKFKDIAGNEEAKEEIKEIVDYLKDPKKYEASGARMPHGILLGGPPGTGKTLLAKATAGEANVPFYFISASSFVEMYVGLGAKRVRQVVAEARKNAPAIIFIDELDAIGRTRGSGIGGGHDEREQTLNQLLVEMDGIQGNSGLLFFAATNRTDVLDPALVRPGRFDRTITVGLPNVKEREEILKLHATGKRFDPAVDFKNIAKRTPGYSGAQLENVINEATLLSVRENTKVITLSQIDEAIDRVMSGPAKKTRTITKKELTMVAYHEAGHAVVGIKVPGASKVQKITIIPRGDAGGYNLIIPEEEKYNMTKSELMATIASFMGGRAAESIIYGDDNVSTGASNDIEKATNIARRMVTQYGMSDLGPVRYENDEGSPFLGRTLATHQSYSSRTGQEIDAQIRKIINDAKELAEKIILENRKLLELIKERLLEKETIVSEEIEYIVKHMQLPPDSEEHKQSEEVHNITIDELIAEVETDTKEKENE
nr:ATP-dependent zinc metalloprotease FtsH [Mycoplasmopsis pullorum]